jgi:hypothetical protein
MEGGIIGFLDVSVGLTLGATIDRINSKGWRCFNYWKKYSHADGERWQWKFDILYWRGLHGVLLSKQCNKMKTWGFNTHKDISYGVGPLWDN